jgi:hypothetical protein
MVYNRRDGHFYSSKPPVLTIILAGVLKPFHLLGAEFQFAEPEAARPTVLLTWLVIGSATAYAFYTFRRKVGRFIGGVEGDLVTVLALGGTLFLSYSATMNHHTFTAALVLLSFFLLGMDEGLKELSARRVATAGFLMGLAAVVDIGPGFIFSIAFALYIALFLHSWRGLLLFGLGSLPPLGLHCLVQYETFGTILPVQMLAGTKDYPGSYWHAPLEPDSWVIPRSRYWVLTLFSMRGLLVVSPILLVGAAGLIGTIRRAIRAAGAPEADAAGPAYAAVTVLFGVVFLVIYYSFVAEANFCGSCFGMRWYIGFTPLLSFYAASEYAQWRQSARFRAIFYMLGLVSLGYALIGMQQPWLLMEANPHPAVQCLRVLRGF